MVTLVPTAQADSPLPKRVTRSTATLKSELEQVVESIPEKDLLRDRVLQELTSIGFALEGNHLRMVDSSREALRQLHSPARALEINRSRQWIDSAWQRHGHLFANGSEIDPSRIQPMLKEVKTDRELEVFRLARYTWSLPYSRGFGRRLQFLLTDQHNGKLIGILGMQSPPLDFRARDKTIVYPSKKRKTVLVNQMMDIFTLGAVPPYNFLLGGKLVALAAASNEVREAYQDKYRGQKTEIENRRIPAHLVALTTTSAYGRSSIYNRLAYKESVRFNSLGFTEGYGAFHLDRLYPLFKQVLAEADVEKRLSGYGTGPRIKWQVITLVSSLLGIKADLLHHGIQREAFLVPLVTNLYPYLQGQVRVPEYIDVGFVELAEFWKTRWLAQRATSNPQWREWEQAAVFEDIARAFES